MQVIRNLTEAPSASDVVGTTRFVGSRMRPSVFKHGQAAQDANNGNTTVNTSAGAYTVLPSDGLVVYTLATAGTNVYTLPLAAKVGKGHEVTFKKILGTSVVRLTCAGSDVIDAAGTTTHDMTAAGRIVTLRSDGSATWYIVQSVTAAAA